jgi:hypothetical protein
MLAGSIHPPFRLNFPDPTHLYSSTTLLSSNNERASHLLLHHKVLHEDKSIRTSTLASSHNLSQQRKIKENKIKEPAKLINDKISIQEEMKESGKQEDDDPCI